MMISLFASKEEKEEKARVRLEQIKESAIANMTPISNLPQEQELNFSNSDHNLVLHIESFGESRLPQIDSRLERLTKEIVNLTQERDDILALVELAKYRRTKWVDNNGTKTSNS